MNKNTQMNTQIPGAAFLYPSLRLSARTAARMLDIPETLFRPYDDLKAYRNTTCALSLYRQFHVIAMAINTEALNSVDDIEAELLDELYDEIMRRLNNGIVNDIVYYDRTADPDQVKADDINDFIRRINRKIRKISESKPIEYMFEDLTEAEIRRMVNNEVTIPTLKIVVKHPVADRVGYLTPFRAYSFQVSGNVLGDGDQGSSEITDITELARNEDVDKLTSLAIDACEHFGCKPTPDELHDFIEKCIVWLKVRRMGGSEL